MMPGLSELGEQKPARGVGSFRPMGDYLKAALYFEECAEQEPAADRAGSVFSGPLDNFRWLAIAEARSVGTADRGVGVAIPAD